MTCTEPPETNEAPAPAENAEVALKKRRPRRKSTRKPKETPALKTSPHSVEAEDKPELNEHPTVDQAGVEAAEEESQAAKRAREEETAGLEKELEGAPVTKEEIEEALDYYLEALETKEVTSNGFAAAVIVLEQSRMECEALRRFLIDTTLQEVVVGYTPLVRAGALETEDPKHRLLGKLLGRRKFSRAEVIRE